MQQNQQTHTQPPQPPQPQPTGNPNEKGTIAVSGFVKISDPSTKQVFVETRA